MNPTIDLLKAHRSIRKFTDKPIEADLLQELVLAGQAAATSSFLQGTTVIRVTRPEVRAQFAELAGNQGYIKSAAEFLVFCADLRRSAQCCATHGREFSEGMTEHFMIATIDVALFAQSTAVAAESAGLGICYIGGIRNDPQRASDLLELPRNVYPVFGLCLGYPDQDPEVKPRLPLDIVLKQDTYTDATDQTVISEYDEIVREYYKTRTGNQKEMSWSEQMSGLLGKESRPHMRDFLARRGFAMR
ncbi:MAG: oxygen-insensitive NADPH nitroreductase [Burkholderiaceae bacterium]